MNKLKRYAELKQIIFNAEQEINNLKADVTSLVFDEEGEKLDTEWGRFELRNGRPKWVYSNDLIMKEKQIKEKLNYMKKEEEISGVAKQETAPANLVFTIRKEK